MLLFAYLSKSFKSSCYQSWLTNCDAFIHTEKFESLIGITEIKWRHGKCKSFIDFKAFVSQKDRRNFYICFNLVDAIFVSILPNYNWIFNLKLSRAFKIESPTKLFFNKNL